MYKESWPHETFPGATTGPWTNHWEPPFHLVPLTYAASKAAVKFSWCETQVSLGNWMGWFLCLGWKVGSTRTNLLASQLRNTGELLQPLPTLKQQQQKQKRFERLLHCASSPAQTPSPHSHALIERYLHCKLKGPSCVAVLTPTLPPKMSTNSSNLITERDLLQITRRTKGGRLLLTWG